MPKKQMSYRTVLNATALASAVEAFGQASTGTMRLVGSTIRVGEARWEFESEVDFLELLDPGVDAAEIALGSAAGSFDFSVTRASSRSTLSLRLPSVAEVEAVSAQAELGAERFQLTRPFIS
jgi:hypothetical protein